MNIQQVFLVDLAAKEAVDKTVYTDEKNAGLHSEKVFLRATAGEVGLTFKAEFTLHGEPYEFPEDAAFSVWYEGSSGAGNYTQINGHSPFALEGNVLQIEVIQQMISVPGGGTLGVLAHGRDGEIRKLFQLTYITDEIPGYGSDKAEDYFTAFSEAVKNAMDSADLAVQSAEQASDAAAAFTTDASLCADGVAADAAAVGAALAGKAPLALGAPHNYLDNSDFRNPVNQRGLSEYSIVGNGYTVDRWFAYQTGVTVQVWVMDGYIRVETNNVSGTATLSQRFAKDVLSPNKTYTFAYMNTDGEITIKYNPVNFDNASLDYVQISLGSNQAIELVWAALYEGEYTTETLPDYKPKGYAAELAECQRYFWCFPNGGGSYALLGIGTGVTGTNTVQMLVQYPQTMRVYPTLTFTGALRLVSNDWRHAFTVSNIEVDGNGGSLSGAALVVSTESDLTAGTVYYLSRKNDTTAKLFFSADL